MNPKKRLHPAIAALIVVVLVGMVASAVIIINNNKSDTAEKTVDHSTHDHSDTSSTESTDTSEYENGTYSAVGSYFSPGGRESIELTVVITDGVITDTTIENQATDPEAKEHQELFSSNYKALVVGKEVGSVSLSRVAGSSLTSNGFNDALDQIKDDARV